MKRLLLAATVAGVSMLGSLSAQAFWGPFNSVFPGGWGGPWGGSPWYGYPYGAYPYYGGYPYGGYPVFGGYPYGAPAYPYAGGWGVPAYGWPAQAPAQPSGSTN